MRISVKMEDGVVVGTVTDTFSVRASEGANECTVNAVYKVHNTIEEILEAGLAAVNIRAQAQWRRFATRKDNPVKLKELELNFVPAPRAEGVSKVQKFTWEEWLATKPQLRDWPVSQQRFMAEELNRTGKVKIALPEE